MSHVAYKLKADVGRGGKLNLSVPLPEGTRVEIVILLSDDGLSDELSAAASSMDFWDNPRDDEDWNHA